jgi:hypothetical protein
VARVSLLLRLPDSTEDGIGFEGKLDAIAIGSALRKAPPPQSKALAHEPHTPEARVATEVAEWVSVAIERDSVGCNRAGLCCNLAGLCWLQQSGPSLQLTAAATGDVVAHNAAQRSTVQRCTAPDAMQCALWGLAWLRQIQPWTVRCCACARTVLTQLYVCALRCSQRRHCRGGALCPS